MSGAPLWKPGEAPYALWINNLRENDPVAYQAHLEERRQRKAIKKKFADVVNSQDVALIAVMYNKAMQLLETGGVQEFSAVFDRLIGKPDSAVDITSNGNTLQAPTIIFAAQELDEWKNNDNQDEG